MTRAQVINDINKIEDNGTNTALEVRTVLTDLLDFSDEGISANSQGITTLNLNVNNLTTRVVTLENKVAVHDTEISTLNGNVTSIDNDITLINEELALIGKPFHVWSPTPVTDQYKNLLWYSFKGFVNDNVNFTFKLKIVENDGVNGKDHYFVLDGEIVKILEGILFHFPNVTDKLSFVVSSRNANRELVPFTKIYTATIDLFNDTKTKKSGIQLNFYSSNGTDKDFLIVGDEIFTSIQFHCPEFNFDFNPK
ncbi:hypothetical protein OX283_009370 [Flavobacterium sp. SUN052]|uniref:hypothetical protein n=1 Tax=Flavobacterium sp. SUN052 TaxID=3002441 RepID=UPI00237E66CA|nr:hypothetical protein [Flavobacterium sp. SUN052]MEC4004863.1 hypothetical protein [Flavobacterium sp. SUN052]